MKHKGRKRGAFFDVADIKVSPYHTKEEKYHAV
jgi:hypothetical protein